MERYKVKKRVCGTDRVVQKLNMRAGLGPFARESNTDNGKYRPSTSTCAVYKTTNQEDTKSNILTLFMNKFYVSSWKNPMYYSIDVIQIKVAITFLAPSLDPPLADGAVGRVASRPVKCRLYECPIPFPSTVSLPFPSFSFVPCFFPALSFASLCTPLLRCPFHPLFIHPGSLEISSKLYRRVSGRHPPLKLSKCCMLIQKVQYMKAEHQQEIDKLQCTIVDLQRQLQQHAPPTRQFATNQRQQAPAGGVPPTAGTSMLSYKRPRKC